MRHDEILRNKLTNLFHTILLLAVMLTLLILLGFSLAGTAGLLWAGLIGFFFLLFSPRVSPQFILKMYNARQLSMYDTPRLFRIKGELARRADLPAVPGLYYIPSRVMNAFSVGSRDNAAIGITDGLLRGLNMRELTGILAHEMSHIRNNDMRVMGIADVMSRVTGLFSNIGQILIFFNLPLLLIGAVTISWFAIFLLVTAPLLSGLLQLAISRTREFDADLDAARITGDPEGLASALQKMDRYKSNIFERIFFPGRSIPDPSLLRTHPQTDERVKRLLQLTGYKHPRIIHEPEESFIFPAFMFQVSRDPRWRRISGLWF